MGRREPGYRPEPKLYKITFEERPGLIVRAKAATAGAFLKIARLHEQEPTLEESEDLFRAFAEVLVSWNLEFGDGHELEGELVPTTFDGMMTQSMDLVNEIIVGWMEAVAGISAPLDQPSSGGDLFPVESIPMDVRSQNQAS